MSGNDWAKWRELKKRITESEDIDMEESEAIIALTPYNKVLVEDLSEGPSAEGSTFIVTALDRMNRESDPAIIKWK